MSSRVSPSIDTSFCDPCFEEGPRESGASGELPGLDGVSTEFLLWFLFGSLRGLIGPASLKIPALVLKFPPPFCLGTSGFFIIVGGNMDTFPLPVFLSALFVEKALLLFPATFVGDGCLCT